MSKIVGELLTLVPAIIGQLGADGGIKFSGDVTKAMAAGARSPTRCASPAGGRVCARKRTQRGIGLMATGRSTSCRDSADLWATPLALSRRRRPSRPAAARHRQRHRAAWGNPLYDWASLRDAAIAGGPSALRTHLRPLRHPPPRPLPRLRRVLGGARRTRPTRAPGTGSAGPGGRSFDAAARRARRTAGDRRGPRRHHPEPVERLRRALGFPGMAVLQFAL